MTEQQIRVLRGCYRDVQPQDEFPYEFSVYYFWPGSGDWPIEALGEIDEDFDPIEDDLERGSDCQLTCVRTMAQAVEWVVSWSEQWCEEPVKKTWVRRAFSNNFASNRHNRYPESAVAVG